MSRSSRVKHIEVRSGRRSGGSLLWILAAVGALAYYLSKPANRDVARQKLDEIGLSGVTDRVAQATSESVKRLQDTAAPVLGSLQGTVANVRESVQQQGGDAQGSEHLEQAPGSEEKNALQELKESLQEARRESQQ
ncbi:hypothetical protein [Deinococcus peraridilitoris]|uniref:Uncharacterized protein n=1 Tax=Deinococcus peraridilitoris (strain DSM 19664 / LMG 22246 / CIP 109416 / KR-200) TaxID=937777 RepID=L0A5F9_DEIPD|nr:hypothetical protein [Deinococcus peraridilitoris]AFZ68664.1 hypothetical protein Deipe_3221 [Deinococcus peraridilitoris DSM 19664]